MWYTIVTVKEREVLQMKILITFIILNVVNVILQTVKSIVTVKCGKIAAAVINAVTFAVYTIVLVYMSCELSTIAKALVVGACNLVGVYIVKAIEEKTNKDKLWKIEMTCPNIHYTDITTDLDFYNLAYTTISINDKYFGIAVYAPTQTDSEKVKTIVTKYNVKYFVTESKVL